MKINLDLLLVAIIIGISIIYIFSPKPEVILKMPNESNIYIDNNVVKNIKKIEENSTQICDSYESRIPDYINLIDFSVFH